MVNGEPTRRNPFNLQKLAHNLQCPVVRNLYFMYAGWNKYWKANNLNAKYDFWINIKIICLICKKHGKSECWN